MDKGMTADLPDAAPLAEPLGRAAALVAQAQALLVCAGAGMGVDSGLPDFRGDQGFWAAYPALGRARLSFTDAANAQRFQRDPALAWGFYGHRLALYRRTQPHPGFALLRQWGQHMPGGCFVFTSNVDGQFQKAGFDEQAIEECHGSIHHLQCSQPCSESIWRADAVQPSVDEAACRWLGALPCCPQCGAVLRPNVLMFDDWQWSSLRRDAQHARLQAWLARQQQAGHRLLVMELGAGTAIATVRRMAMQARQKLAAQHARLIRINPRAPGVSGPYDVGLPLGALHALQQIDQRLDQHLKG